MRWRRAREALDSSAEDGGETVVDIQRYASPQNASHTSRLRSDDLLPVRGAALKAEQSGHHEQAIELWRQLIRDASFLSRHFRTSRFSAEPHFKVINGLIHLKRFEEAEAALKRIARRFPLHPSLLIARGKLAAAQEDWDLAIAVWRRFHRLFPWDTHGWDHLGRAVAAKHLALAMDGAGTPERAMPVKIARVQDEAACKLLLGFESIGDDCEFGMVQRRYGAEPLGLLRWNYVPLADLMAALGAGFCGVGEPQHTELWFAENGSETFIRDKRWGLPLHTFMSKAQVDEAAFYPKACRRAAFLRDKLLADLAAGEKIMVFKTADILPEAMRALHAALQAFGNIRLLCIKPANVSSPHSALCGKPGEVFEISDGLYVGFISRVGNANGSWNIAFDDWLAICRGVETAPFRRLRPDTALD